MKRLLLTLAFLGALLVLPVQAFAAHYWKIQMSDPSIADQSRAFNLDYTTLTTDTADKITVKLLQNGIGIGSQTTIAGGDSGSFLVTVPSDGSYTYHLSARSSSDGSAKITASKVVSVVTPVEGQPSEVTVQNINGAQGADGVQNNNTDTTTQSNTDDTTDNDEGIVEGVTDREGTVDGEAAIDEKLSESAQSLWWILALVAIAIVGYYGYSKYRSLNED